MAEKQKARPPLVSQNNRVERPKSSGLKYLKKVAELPRQGKENHIYGTVDREYVDMERQYENGEQKPVYFNQSSSS